LFIPNQRTAIPNFGKPHNFLFLIYCITGICACGTKVAVGVHNVIFLKNLIVKIKTLYLESLAGDTVLALTKLAKAGIACDVLTVNDELGYRDALGWFCPQLVIAEDANPAINALEAIKLLKQTAPAVPFIAVSTTEYNNVREIIEIMRAGAFDYLVMDRLNDLPGVVKLAIKKQEAGLNNTCFSAPSGDGLFFPGIFRILKLPNCLSEPRAYTVIERKSFLRILI